MESRNQHRLQEYEKILQSEPIANKVLQSFPMRQITSETDKLYVAACAPVAVSFVNWILKKAIEKQINRLYFLARDGYPFYLTAKYLCEVWNLDIDCRYLSVSRYAIRLPEYHLLGRESLDRICIGGIDVTFRKILKRADLNEDEILRVAELSGYSCDIDKVLNYREITELKCKLQSIDALFDFIEAHSGPAYDNAIGYLIQEGLLDTVSYALVDSGWTGTLQQSIQNLLRTKKPEATVQGFYFGLYEIPKEMAKEQYHSYFFSPKKGLKQKVYFSNCLFEAIFSAPDGMTLKYSICDGRYVPMRDERRNRNACLLERNTVLLRKYLEEYTKEQSDFCVSDSKEPATVRKLLKMLMARPTSLEIEAFGNQVFSDDILEHDMHKVAVELSEEDIKNLRFWRKLMIFAGIRKATIHESAWLEASIVRNGININRNLRHAAFYKYFLYVKKRLFNGSMERKGYELSENKS